MLYYGKKRDTFAYVMDILMKESGRERVPHIECASGRPFCLKCQGDVRRWFETAIPVPQAVRNLNHFVFEGKEVIRYSESTALNDEKKYRMILADGCAVGPIREGGAIAHLQDRFYCGCQHFLFMRYDEWGHIEITDPLGTPVYHDNERDAEELLKCGDYVIWILPRRDAQRQVEIDWNGVLASGFDSREHYIGEQSSIEKYDFINNYHASGSTHTSLHMAINHYLRQMAEVANLLDSLSEDAQFRRETRELFSKVSEIKYTENIQSLPVIDNTIWETYYDRYRICKIN